MDQNGPFWPEEVHFGPFRSANHSLAISSLAAQNRESRIARFPESRAWNRQNFRSEKQLPSESHSANASSDLGIARSLDSRFRVADSVPLRSPHIPKLSVTEKGRFESKNPHLSTGVHKENGDF